ncbi:hypothetical protein F5050DRAFT_1751663 [Lentinula boryana]|uniref:Uncharacterized protein n=1 Tax=Lentinula boryana TaxID=40481 RepID=A0ABQ8QGG2_9AGAR|nr:hypothetical protein F5050DRAFT_1751663 [Lentinula boryana]
MYTSITTRGTQDSEMCLVYHVGRQVQTPVFLIVVIIVSNQAHLVFCTMQTPSITISCTQDIGLLFRSLSCAGEQFRTPLSPILVLINVIFTKTHTILGRVFLVLHAMR